MVRFAVIVATLIASSLSAQGVLHYKFEAGEGHTVFNYAARTGLAPAVATLREAAPPPDAAAWTDGRFGRAFAGYATEFLPKIQLDSGWSCGFEGSFTVAMFVRMRFPLPFDSGAILYRCSNGSSSGSFSAAISGVDGKFGINWPNTQSMWTSTDVLTLAAADWVHLAFVADATTGIGTFYINGAREIPFPIRSISVEPNLDGMRIGSNGSGSFDIDEFRLRLGTATESEIQQWASMDPAADGGYGVGCFPRGREVLLDSNSTQAGMPAIGNADYQLELYGLPGSAYQLFLGSSRTTRGALPLPLDLGTITPSLAGCSWETSAEVATPPGTIPATGLAVLPAGVPAIPELVGIDVYLQAVLYSPALDQLMTSNAFAVAIGG